MLAAVKVPGALKWIEDRLENLMAAGQSRHEHGDVRMAFDTDGTILAATIDYGPWQFESVAREVAAGNLRAGPRDARLRCLRGEGEESLLPGAA